MIPIGVYLMLVLVSTKLISAAANAQWDPLFMMNMYTKMNYTIALSINDTLLNLAKHKYVRVDTSRRFGANRRTIPSVFFPIVSSDGINMTLDMDWATNGTRLICSFVKTRNRSEIGDFVIGVNLPRDYSWELPADNLVKINFDIGHNDASDFALSVKRNNVQISSHNVPTDAPFLYLFRPLYSGWLRVIATKLADKRHKLTNNYRINYMLDIYIPPDIAWSVSASAADASLEGSCLVISLFLVYYLDI